MVSRTLGGVSASVAEVAPAELSELLASPFVDEWVAEHALALVRGRVPDGVRLGSLPLVVAALEPGPAADLVVDERDVDDLAGAVTAAPIAARSLAVLLRAVEQVDVEAGLALESAVYSTLQAGPEFAAWRAAAPHRPDAAGRPTVQVERRGDMLAVTLDRPERHNAISARLRDDLAAALAIAIADRSIHTVELRGHGPSFCSGGDLGEFGARSDPATAHVVRLNRSPARMMHRLRERTTVHVHGATLGGGIETAAFAGTVLARPDTSIGLPEIGLGLIPGAGGTVSISRRIGRQRTAWLALTGRRIDAVTAHEWGLVDGLDEGRD